MKSLKKYWFQLIDAARLIKLIKKKRNMSHCLFFAPTGFVIFYFWRPAIRRGVGPHRTGSELFDRGWNLKKEGEESREMEQFVVVTYSFPTCVIPIFVLSMQRE